MTAETIGQDKDQSLLAFFGDEAKRLRLERGWSQSETAKKVLATQAMISYIETAKRIATEAIAKGLDTAFGTDGHFERLHPVVMRYAYPVWFLPYVEFEATAQTIRTTALNLIPGLLQTEEYARAVFSTGRSRNPNDAITARLSRQSIFDREDPPRSWFVIDEAALRRQIGGRVVMQGQFANLLRAYQNYHTVIQVIPETVSTHPGLDGPFTVLSFDEGADVLHVDGFSQGRMALDEAEVSRASHVYDLLRAIALSPDASADLIRRRLEEIS